MSREEDQRSEGETDAVLESQGRRGIRSYVIPRRTYDGGANGQTLSDSGPCFGLSPENGLIDPGSLFEQTGPLTFEIGFGMGRSLVETATAHPNHRFISVEVHRPGVGALLMEVEQRGLTNLGLLL